MGWEGYPKWWPDWAGEDMMVVASGPSAANAQVELARGKVRTIAVNTSIELVPWADALYACDVTWWNYYKGYGSFHGLKLTPARKAAEDWGLELVKCRKPDPRALLENPGEIGWGGSGGFQAFNLALHMQPKNLFLVGFDMNLGGKQRHWHADHPEPMHNPKSHNMPRWARAMDSAAKAAEQVGTTVINCSMKSAITAYQKMTLKEALDARISSTQGRESAA